MKKILASAITRRILFGLGIFIAGLLIFQAGVSIGYRKASFSYGWGDNYHGTFGSRDRGFMGMGMMGGDFSNAHGTVGTIVKVSLPTLIVEDRDKTEKEVTVTDTTIINRFREAVKSTDLKVGDSIIVIGAPNQSSQIEAKVIRIVPEPPKTMMGTTSQKTLW